MYLATTADQRFWNKEEKILFLGELCKVYSQRHVWSELDYEVLPYHWESRDRYFQDYQSLDRLYERLLPSFAERLNALHNEKHSVRYWRTIISPWLYYFIQTLYDRYLSIRHAIDSGKVTSTNILSLDKANYIPKDFLTFQRWGDRDDYNLFLYSKLINTLGGIPFEVNNNSCELECMPNQPGSDLKSRIKKGMKQVLGIYSRLIPQRLNEVVMVSMYMNAIDLIRLQVSLGQLPYPHAPMVMPSKVAFDFELRKELEISCRDNEFESILSKFIPGQMPMAYLEGYSELKKEAKRVFPKTPKAIFYVNAHFSNEGFKIWSADRMEKGTKLIGTQHGGHYGSSLWSANEGHEIKISDQYCTWGWEEPDQPKLVPLASLQLAGVKNRIRYKPDGDILWIGMSRPRYSSWMFSAPIGVQMLEYIEDQKQFLDTLLPEVKDLLQMRLFHADYNWSVRERLSEAMSGLRFNRDETVWRQLCKSRLCIGTYNSTTNLETLAADFPTIAFWNFDHWKLRESADPYYKDMVRAGIFHVSPESAATKVNKVYADPWAWWMSVEVRQARRQFCDRFARVGKSWISEWRKNFSQL